MGANASQITSLTIVFSTVYSDADQRKHQSSASLAFVRGIHRGLVNSLHKWPVMRKMSPFDDVIMKSSLFKIMACCLFDTNSLNQCWLIRSRTNCSELNESMLVFILNNVLNNVVCEMSTILPSLMALVNSIHCCLIKGPRYYWSILWHVMKWPRANHFPLILV